MPVSLAVHALPLGGEFGWLSPFALICGAGLCLSYTLLGAFWLVRKSDGELRESACRLVPYLSVELPIFLIAVFGYAFAEHLRVIGRWLERSYLFVRPAIGIAAEIVLAASVRYRRDGPPFYMVCLIFIAAFGTLAISFWPYMISFSITIDEAAAPHSSVAFMFWSEGCSFSCWCWTTPRSAIPCSEASQGRAGIVTNAQPRRFHA
jgi:cytochrome d ubiquinol oxidase subunit II